MILDRFSLADRVALVTGAGSGIGQAIAYGVAEAGAAVGCVDLHPDGLATTVAGVRERGGQAVALTADVTARDAIGDAVNRATATLGPVTLAVNSAGIASSAPAEEMEAAQWQQVIQVNLTGVFLSCQAEFASMRDAGGGAIVNVASMSGSIVNRGIDQAHYNSSKAAVMQLTKSLAMEWAEHNIRVNSISPGYTSTPMNLRPEVANRVRTFERDTPVGRMAEIDEQVGPAVFLLSDAGSFCTGVDLLVDGGFTCW